MSQASFTGFISIEDIKKPKYDINNLLHFKQQNNSQIQQKQIFYQFVKVIIIEQQKLQFIINSQSYQQNEINLVVDPNGSSFVRDILPIKIQNFEIKRLEWDDFTGEPNKESPWIAHSYWNIHYELPKKETSRASSNQKQSPTVTNQKNTNTNINQQSQKFGLSPKNQTQITQSSSERRNVKQQSPKLPPKIPLQQDNIQNRTNSRLQKQIPTPALRIASLQGQKRQLNQKTQTPQKKSSRSNSNSTLIKQQSPRQQLNILVCCKLLEKSWTKSNEYGDLLEHETGHYLIGCLCALEFKRKAELMEFCNTEEQKQEIKQIFQTNFRTFLKIEKDYDEETSHYCNWRMQMKWNRKIKEQLLLYEMYFNN